MKTIRQNNALCLLDVFSKGINMKIAGIGSMSVEQLNQAIDQGGKFVIYEYCISVLIMTFKRPSDIQFIPAGSSRFKKGIGFTLTSLLLGWWGFPWGPIYTIGSLATNLRGGRDVTKEVLLSLR
jgi:hypothetical protein